MNLTPSSFLEGLVTILPGSLWWVIKYTPNSFLLQCHLYFENLKDPKPTGWTINNGLLLSWLTALYPEWTELLCRQHEPCLRPALLLSSICSLSNKLDYKLL